MDSWYLSEDAHLVERLATTDDVVDVTGDTDLASSSEDSADSEGKKDCFFNYLRSAFSPQNHSPNGGIVGGQGCQCECRSVHPVGSCLYSDRVSSDTLAPGLNQLATARERVDSTGNSPVETQCKWSRS